MASLWRRGAVFALSLLVAPFAFSDEPAVTKRATELREAPGSGRTLASLPAQAPVTRLTQRQGAWIQVRTSDGAQGWVHLFDLASVSGAARNEDTSGSGALRGVTNFFTRGSTTATAASGIRGLGAEDLARATPNPAAVGQLEGLRQNEGGARAFARSAALSPVAVEPLPEPARSGGAPAGAQGAPAGPGGDPSRQ